MTDRDKALDDSIVDRLRRSEGAIPPRKVVTLPKADPAAPVDFYRSSEGYNVGADGNVYPLDIKRRGDDKESNGVMRVIGLLTIALSAATVLGLAYILIFR